MALLEVRELSVSYGEVEALRSVSFSVDEGAIGTLIGANGAGKSTTLLTVSGLIRPQAGTIWFDGTNITGWRPDRIVRAGLVQVPEGRAILQPLTVAENLELGAWVRRDAPGIRADLGKLFNLFPRLAERRHQAAGTLSGGEQQMLAIARALMSRPRLLLLDEPSMGLAPLMINAIFDLVQTIHDQGTTVLLVEQNARKALKMSTTATVLEHGAVVRQGTGAEVLADPGVVKAFLGGATT